MTAPDRLPSFEISSLTRAYATGELSPRDVLELAYARSDASSARNIWIERLPLRSALGALADAEERRAAGEHLPLFGIPFAVKDNVDVSGVPTTAGCPSFSYVPAASATVVSRLVRAGAIVVGKTNLDQFATGLVGVRSPYGACSCAFDERYISGGSSSGSALAVALGLVSFALGTDTAGSGRIPAAFNNVVGYKPTRGVLSTAGVVPACRSLDCVSVFAGSASDAAVVALAAAGSDPSDPYSRPPPADRAFARPFRFGVPRSAQLEFFGDREAPRLFETSIAELEKLGGTAVEVDFEPFRAAGALLYQGPWVAERLAALEAFLARRPKDIDPTVFEIISQANSLGAVDAFRGMYRLKALERETAAAWQTMDLLLVPTAGTTYTLEAVHKEPVRLNTNLGFYTNFVNLLDLSAVAVPAGFRSQGLPFGVTLIAPAGVDRALLRLADAFHRAQSPRIGATEVRLSELADLSAEPVGQSALAAPASPVGQPALAAPARPVASEGVLVAVVGAHLSGQPLNHELTSRGGRLVKACKTALQYRLYALPSTSPPKPGLVYDPDFAGPGVEVEVWSLDVEAFGAFVAGVRAPLSIGTLCLEDGSSVHGFLCEGYAVRDAREITAHGGWRAYLESAQK